MEHSIDMPAMTVDRHSEKTNGSGATLVEVSDLTVRYGTLTAVNGVTFTVYAGEVFGLLGPNGAGKTSILSCAEGLLTPSSGHVRVAGFDIRTQSRLARLNLGVQLQASSCKADLTVAETIRLYCGLYGVTEAGVKVESVIKEYELGRVASTPVGRLSGGQQQNVSLAIATVHNPSVVLLDEPTTGLDPQSRRKLWERVIAMRDAGCAIVLTTHSMEEAQSICDRIAIINRGVIIAADTPSGLIERYRSDPFVRSFSNNGSVTLEDVFIGLTSKEANDASR